MSASSQPTESHAAMSAAMAATEQAMAAASADIWAGSPHAWLKNIPSSRRRGKAGELIMQDWLQGIGMTVGKPASSDADRNVNGQGVEVKMSTLWDGGDLRWQQIRDQDYTHALLLGIEPQRLRVWCVPKDVLRAHATPQHAGKNGTDTLWLVVKADAIPAWMNPWGGDLDTAAAVVIAALGSAASATP